MERITHGTCLATTKCTVCTSALRGHALGCTWRALATPEAARSFALTSAVRPWRLLRVHPRRTGVLFTRRLSVASSPPESRWQPAAIENPTRACPLTHRHRSKHASAPPCSTARTRAPHPHPDAPQSRSSRHLTALPWPFPLGGAQTPDACSPYKRAPPPRISPPAAPLTPQSPP